MDKWDSASPTSGWGHAEVLSVSNGTIAFERDHRTSLDCAPVTGKPSVGPHDRGRLNFRVADNARTNCVKGAIVVTDLINIHEVSLARAKSGKR
jgi:hypothetical protein